MKFESIWQCSWSALFINTTGNLRLKKFLFIFTLIKCKNYKKFTCVVYHMRLRYTQENYLMANICIQLKTTEASLTAMRVFSVLVTKFHKNGLIIETGHSTDRQEAHRVVLSGGNPCVFHLTTKLCLSSWLWLTLDHNQKHKSNSIEILWILANYMTFQC